MIIATVALVVIGPKDLPRVLRQLGQMVNRVRRMANEFQGQFMDAMKEADLQDIKNEVAKLKDTATLDLDFDPARDIKSHLDDAMNPPAAPVPVTAEPSTSEARLPNLPSPSEIEPPSSIASEGFGPAVDGPLPAESASEPAGAEALDGEAAPAIATHPGEPVRRKTVLVRRRVGARAEGAGRGAPWPRSRNILPARRETPDQ